MSKIGAYLQEHISGEVSLSRDVRESASRDGSVLKLKPEMVIYPKHTNDIRKIARFSWQLAERGHALPITARGLGSDVTGAAIGNGIVLSLPTHLYRIFEYEPKQKLVRLQPGVLASTLSSALQLQGVRVPSLPHSQQYSTVGGAVANNSRNMLSGKYGSMSEWVDRLEVVLANGEVIQTGRISKRELSRKKGLGTLEGEIYRTIDSLIEDNQELVASLAEREIGTNAGYCSIASVKRKDGSIDLTPLIIGSQGTLGIISEMILRTIELASGLAVMVAAFKDEDVARDVADTIIAKEKPTFLETFDSEVFEQASLVGKGPAILKEVGFDYKTVLLIGFDDFSGRSRAHHVKKAKKIIEAAEGWHVSGEGAEAEELLSIRDALVWTASSDNVEFGAPTVLGAAYVPPEGVSVFRSELKTLGKKHGMKLPVYGQDMQSLYYVWPNLNLKKAGDKQKMLKLLDEYARLVQKVSGELVGSDGEGRLKARFALSTFDDDALKLFADIKAVFDPHKMLNPGVKEMLEVKQLAPMIQGEASIASLPNYVPRM